MESLRSDITYAIRNLWKRPGFTLIAVLTLAVGIGANTAIFSAINALILKPLPFHELDRVVAIWDKMPALGLEWHDSFVAHDEITGEDWSWTAHNYVRLDPGYEPAHVIAVRRTR